MYACILVCSFVCMIDIQTLKTTPVLTNEVSIDLSSRWFMDLNTCKKTCVWGTTIFFLVSFCVNFRLKGFLESKWGFIGDFVIKKGKNYKWVNLLVRLAKGQRAILLCYWTDCFRNRYLWWPVIIKHESVVRIQKLFLLLDFQKERLGFFWLSKLTSEDLWTRIYCQKLK